MLSLASTSQPLRSVVRASGLTGRCTLLAGRSQVPVQKRLQSTVTDATGRAGTTEIFRVTLDRTSGTVYVDQQLAEALGWSPEKGRESVPLTLSGWAPHYFAITAEGTDADLLARGTVESSKNPVLQDVFEDLKER